jgi:hypothetical protein
MKPVILDPSLYERAKKIVYARYSKPSAFRSGALQSMYKEMGGRYGGEKGRGSLTRWFAEAWGDVNPAKAPGSYPVFRPTVRVDASTPLTRDEVEPRNLREQAALKQRIRGKKNLPPFKAKKVAIV